MFDTADSLPGSNPPPLSPPLPTTPAAAPPSQTGSTPLHAAAQFGHVEVMTYLLSVGANIEAALTVRPWRVGQRGEGRKASARGASHAALVRQDDDGEMIMVVIDGGIVQGKHSREGGR